MACCCKNNKTDKMAVSCLGRCDLPKHHCLDREDVRPGPIPKCMGWLYTAKDSPQHQLRCGWRPGHISCPVLRRIEEHNCGKCGQCNACLSVCRRPPRCSANPCAPCPPRCPPFAPPCGTFPCLKPSCGPFPCIKPPCGPFPCRKPSCGPFPCGKPPCGKPCGIPCGPLPCGKPCPSQTCTSCNTSCNHPSCVPPCTKPMIRIIRHGGEYSIITKPDDITNHPSGPYPLKYVMNTDGERGGEMTKYAVEAKYNDYHFDYVSSQTSFVLDFSPPDNKCYAPCPKKSSVCFPCQGEKENNAPPKKIS